MAKMKNDNLFRLIACVAVSMLLVVALGGCGGKDKDKPEDPNTATDQPDETSGSEVGQAGSDPIASAADLFREPSMKVQNIVNAAKTWDPQFRPWWGKIAPDFTMTDVDGNVQKLSNYRGKNVILVIWRTTNATCGLLASQLKELRGSIPEKDLAILTVSNEAADRIKAFAAQQGVDFTLLSGQNLEAPYSDVQYAPSSFFVGPEGRFKLAARGYISAADAKAIVQAQ